MNKKIEFQIKNEILGDLKIVTNKAPLLLKIYLGFSILTFLLTIILLFTWSVGLVVIIIPVFIWTNLFFWAGMIVSIKKKNFKIMYLNIIIFLIIANVIFQSVGVFASSMIIDFVDTKDASNIIKNLNISEIRTVLYSTTAISTILITSASLKLIEFVIVFYNITTGSKRELKNRLTKEGYEVVNEEELTEENKEFIQKVLRK